MSDELLERATRALSAKYAPEKLSSRGDVGSRRLVRSLADARAYGARLRLIALVAAVPFIGVTAWATASDRLPRWLRGGRIDGGASPIEQVGRRVIAPPAPLAVPIAPPAELPRAEEVAPPPAPGSRPPTVRQRAADIVTKSEPVSSAAPLAPDLDALYRDAHEAHFVRRDPGAALAAWDRYIAAAGANGRMTLEARYNRAMALLRLGRNDEARSALQPFARGEFGGYRRDDAARLLESLP